MTDERVDREPALTDTVRRGVRWVAGAQYAGMLVRLGVAVVLARLLGPAEFGVMALAMAIIGVAALLQESGLGAALVRHRGALAPAAGAMLLLTIAGGTLLGAATWLAAPHAARWLAQPQLAPVLQVMAAACLLRALAQTPRALLQRELRFRPLATLELGATIVYGTVGIALAVAGIGLWSLVAAQLASEATLTAGVWLLRPVRVPRGISADVVRSLAAFGRPVMAANLLGLLHAQLPTLVAGRLLGATPLGVYAMATRWASLPVLGITHVAGRVAYPALARVGDDRPRLAAAWLRVLGTVLALAVPAAVGLAVVADPLVRTLYDARWLPAIAPLRWLAFAGLFHATAASTGEVFKAAGRPRWVAFWALVYNVVLATALWFLVTRAGLVGVALAVALAPAVVMVGCVATAARLLGVPARALGTRAGPPLAGALALAATALAVRALVRGLGGGAGVELVAGGIAGGAVYVLVLAALAPASLEELRGLVGLAPRAGAAAPRRIRPRAVRAVMLAGATVVTLALAGELTLRLLAHGPSPAALGVWNARRPWEAVRTLGADATPTPVSGGQAVWRLQPWSPAVEYRLDEDGFRIAGATTAGPGTRCEVVVLGDSNAFGYGIDANAALDARLDETGAGVTVRNAGLCGANVRHLATWAATVTARAQPDVVVLVVSPWSLRLDVPPEATAHADGFADRIARRWRPFARWSALAERTGWHTGHALDRITGWPGRSVVSWELEPLHEPAAAFARRWDGVRPVLDALLAAATAGGARAVLVYVPLDVQVSRARNALYRDARLPYPSYGFVERDYTADDRYQRVLAPWAASRGVPWLDATALLRARADTAFLRDDYHLSATGYHALAEALGPLAAAACSRAGAPHAPPADAPALPVRAAAAASHPIP